MRVDVFGNRLYVTAWAGILFVFDHADALVDFQEPSAVINPSVGAVGHGGDMKMAGDTLYVTEPTESRGIKYEGKEEKADTVGMTAFRPGHPILTGQNAALSFDATNSQIGQADGLSNEGEVLFVASVPPCCGLFGGDIHIFDDANTLAFPRPADMVLPAMKDFFLPIAIDSNTFVIPVPAN
jgi:hypothetical protein